MSLNLSALRKYCAFHRPLSLCSLVLALGLFGLFGIEVHAQPSVQTPEAKVELVAHAPEGIGAGKAAYIGLLFEHSPGWHTYWKNPGDSGLAIELQWKLPNGVGVGEILWPIPHKIPVGSLANYGYEGKVLFALPLELSQSFKPSLLNPTLPISVHAKWLICKSECIPRSGDFAIDLPLNSSTAAHSALFENSLQSVPAVVQGLAKSQLIDGTHLELTTDSLPTAWHGKSIEVFPVDSQVFEAAPKTTSTWQNSAWSSVLSVSPYRQNAPQRPSFWLVTDLDGQRKALILHSEFTGDWLDANPSTNANTASEASNLPAAASAATSNIAAATGVAAPAASLFWVLFAAFVGGLLLNLMPCVFPILAIKVLGFAKAHESPHLQKRHGLIYGAGVLLSFLLLAALLLALRSAGNALGWGFQLQSPWVVALMILVFSLLTLNLAGAFEFKSFLPNRLATLQHQNPDLEHFMSGVLAVLVASPCTAPFMGAALGAALSMPHFLALLVFAALGLGMALPYVLLAFSPNLLRFLPKPGAWMLTLRKLLAIPMALTTVWLAWVLWQQIGSVKSAPSSAAQAQSWRAWSEASVETDLAQNRAVFVDYTAAWCITCQVNERTVLERPEVITAFQNKQVMLYKADWTRYDAGITASLKKLGRSGIPLYVLYQPNTPPRLFTEFLTQDELLSALQNLPTSAQTVLN